MWPKSAIGPFKSRPLKAENPMWSGVVINCWVFWSLSDQLHVPRTVALKEVDGCFFFPPLIHCSPLSGIHHTLKFTFQNNAKHLNNRTELRLKNDQRFESTSFWYKNLHLATELIRILFIIVRYISGGPWAWGLGLQWGPTQSHPN